MAAKTRVSTGPWDKLTGYPIYWVSGTRSEGDMTLDLALTRNCGNHHVACKPKGTKCSNTEADSRDGGKWGGTVRTSVDASVMEAEQRGSVSTGVFMNNSN